MTIKIGSGPSDITLNSGLGDFAFTDELPPQKYRTTIEVERGLQQSTSGALKFLFLLPDTHSMYKITGSFYFDGAAGNTYRVWGDYGYWSDSHGPGLEGFRYVLKNNGTAAEYADNISGRYFMVAEPVDANGLTVDFEVYIRTIALNGAYSGSSRPGLWGTMRYTHNAVGNALSIFSYQDNAASSSDRISRFDWDIDDVTGTAGNGYCTYVIEALPLVL